MKDLSVVFSKRSLAALFKRFHLTLFIIFIAGILAGVVLLINNVILNPPAADPLTTDNSLVSPQQPTPDSSLAPLQSLHKSSELKSAPATPGGRINPFSGG